MTAVMNNNNNNKNNSPEPGAWIGIDLGTSNCAAAVWDSTRGRPKVLQLGSAAIPRKGKVGRVVPSIVVVVVNNDRCHCWTLRSCSGTYTTIQGQCFESDGNVSEETTEYLRQYRPHIAITSHDCFSITQ
jgi:molecular chaperone DnaK (HSP70)